MFYCFAYFFLHIKYTETKHFYTCQDTVQILILLTTWEVSKIKSFISFSMFSNAFSSRVGTCQILQTDKMRWGDKGEHSARTRRNVTQRSQHELIAAGTCREPMSLCTVKDFFQQRTLDAS